MHICALSSLMAFFVFIFARGGEEGVEKLICLGAKNDGFEITID